MYRGLQVYMQPTADLYGLRSCLNSATSIYCELVRQQAVQYLW